MYLVLSGSYETPWQDCLAQFQTSRNAARDQQIDAFQDTQGSHYLYVQRYVCTTT